MGASDYTYSLVAALGWVVLGLKLEDAKVFGGDDLGLGEEKGLGKGVHDVIVRRGEREKLMAQISEGIKDVGRCEVVRLTAREVNLYLMRHGIRRDDIWMKENSGWIRRNKVEEWSDGHEALAFRHRPWGTRHDDIRMNGCLLGRLIQPFMQCLHAVRFDEHPLLIPTPSEVTQMHNLMTKWELDLVRIGDKDLAALLDVVQIDKKDGDS